MKNRSRRKPWYQILGPAGFGAIMIVILTGIVFLVLAPANAITTVSLPNEIQPVAVNVNIGPNLVETPVPTVTPQPAPTATLAPTPTATATPARASAQVALPTRRIEAAPLPTATPAPTPEPPTPTPLPPLPGINPVRFRIPSLGINAAIEHVGLDSEKRMDVPRSIWNVAWYKLGPQPGQRGNAVIDGHVDGPNTPAVFWDLNKIKLGSKIYVTDEKGQEKVFEVFDLATYNFDAAPIDRIFGESNDAQLNLITCTGQFDKKTANYDKRFVAYTRLMPNA